MRVRRDYSWGVLKKLIRKYGQNIQQLTPRLRLIDQLQSELLTERIKFEILNESKRDWNTNHSLTNPLKGGMAEIDRQPD